MDAPRLRSPARPFLLLAGWSTLCVAAVQAAMPFSDDLVRAFDGPDDWSSPLLFGSSFAVAALLVLVALYAFSGAGLVHRLPLLLTALAVGGVAFLIRGLPLSLLAAGALGFGPFAGDVTWGALVSSAVAFDLGVAYLIGLALLWHGARTPQPSAS